MMRADYTLTTIVAVLHACFLVLEMFLWTKPFGRKTFGLSEAKAEDTKVLGKFPTSLELQSYFLHAADPVPNANPFHPNLSFSFHFPVYGSCQSGTLQRFPFRRTFVGQLAR
jgi:hypothetical protein